MPDESNSQDSSDQETPLPRFLNCARCRREFTINECKAKANTTYEYMTFTCPRCSKALHKIRYKSWYEKLIKGTPAPVLEKEKDPKNY